MSSDGEREGPCGTNQLVQYDNTHALHADFQEV